MMGLTCRRGRIVDIDVSMMSTMVLEGFKGISSKRITLQDSETGP